ncbi:MAG: hypothetical protein AAFX04_03250 [Pseudomonadota bacterium]
MSHFIRMIAIIISISLAGTQSYAQTTEDYQLRNFMELELRELSKKWVKNYRYDSAGFPVVTELSDDGFSAVIKTDYLYTDGKTDTIWMTYRNGKRTCLAYKYWGEYCTLQGKKGGNGAKEIAIAGGILALLAIGSSMSNSNNSNGSKSKSGQNYNDEPTNREKLRQCTLNASNDREYTNCHNKYGY